MSLSRTLHATVASGADVTSVTTGSFTPNANELLVVIVQGTRGDNTGAISAPTGGGLTYTQRAYGTITGGWDFGSSGQNSAYTAIYTAPVGGSPSSMTVTGSFTNTVQSMSVTVLGYTGYDTTTPTGATDSGAEGRQSAVPPAGGAVSDTLSASPASDSEVVAGMALDNDTPSNDHIDTGTGWTQTAELQPGTYANAQSQIRTGSTSSSYGWDGAATDYSRAWAAVEIKAAASGGASLSIPFLAASGALYAPTLAAGNVNLTIPKLGPTGALYAPTLAAGGVNVSIPFLSPSGALYAPTLAAGNANLAIGFLAPSGALYAPTLVPGGVAVAIPFLSPSGALYAPSLVFDGSPQIPFLGASGAPGRKRGRELQEFLDVVALAGRALEPEEETPRPKRRAIKLPARQFEAIPVTYQLPVFEVFGAMVAKGMAKDAERRRLAKAMRDAIKQAEQEADEDDVEAILFLM